MPRNRPDLIKPSEITPYSVYLNRRQFMHQAALAGLAAATVSPWVAALPTEGAPLTGSKSTLSSNEKLTTLESITSYNNYYEFGTDKADPARNAHTLKTRPWTVTVAGACAKPGTVDIDQLIDEKQLEERIYRLRCVEGWSMVIPWLGVPLASVLKRFEPNANAKYVSFTSLNRPEEMPGQKRRVLQWPYQEGLRIDEAMHPLTLLAVGLYGQALPKQNGAPIRLVVPWKYGFKSTKAIVRIEFTETQPPTSWNLSAPSEYGFYSNVNPQVDHPRWSQAKERRIGDLFKRDTLMLNGYADQVAPLYTGMDLQKYF